MTPLLISIGMNISNLPRDVRREFLKRQKPVMQLLGEYWFKKYRSQHFGRGARTRYDYAPRDPEYIENKREKKGPRPDLVFTGKTNRYTAHGERITATSRMTTIKMDLPNYKGPNAKKAGEEITKVNRADKDSLTRYLLAKSRASLQDILKGKKS